MGQNEIKDISSYLQNMSKGIEDKLFFTKFLPKDKYVFIDFGCADGTLLNVLRDIYGDSCTYIGYDKSPEMIAYAESKCEDTKGIMYFTASWGTVRTAALNAGSGKAIVLILSSVIHEIYSYGTIESIEEDWKRILGIAKYVCVRDMMCSQYLSTVVDNYSRREINQVFASKLNLLLDFESRWGSINTRKNLLHFLLKYRWSTNWLREVNENYFPISVEELLEKFKEKYTLVYLERFRIPFLEECWLRDFNIKVGDYTHIKAIFKVKPVK